MKIIPKMIGNVLGALFAKPNTVPYPDKKVPTPERFRGKIEVSDACIACGACSLACPAKTITFDRKSLTYWIPHCIFCGRCADVCPVNAITFSHDYELALDNKELYVKKVFEYAKCAECGKEFMPLSQKKYMIEVKKLPAENFEKCPQCKAKK